MKTCGWKHAGLFLAGFLGVPAVALGQACIGLPAGMNQFAAEAEVGFLEGARSYGVGVGANLVGPFTVEASYAMTTPDIGDENLNTFGANVAFELPMVGFSACPVAGLTYSSIGGSVFVDEVLVEGSTSLITVPVGFGIGVSVPVTPGASLMPYAVPRLLYMRTKVSISALGESASVSDGTTEFGGLLGARMAWSRFFFGGDVAFTTVENSDPTFSVGAGLIFP